MPKIDLNGFGMNYEVHAGLLPMDTVFMHGNLSSNNWWQPAIGLWKKEARPSFEGRAIFAEWRGSGHSDAPESEKDLNPETLAADYIALLEKLNVKKACLVGHSTGGLIGLVAMLKRPDLFHRAVLLDSVGAKGVQFEAPMYDAFTQMSQNRDFCATIMAATIHGVDPKDAHFQRLVDDAFHIAKTNWHGIPNALRTVNITTELSKLTRPVLVLHGEHDPILPLEGSVALAKGLPNGEFRELKGQGHSCNVENPQKFITNVNQFLFER